MDNNNFLEIQQEFNNKFSHIENLELETEETQKLYWICWEKLNSLFLIERQKCLQEKI